MLTTVDVARDDDHRHADGGDGDVGVPVEEVGQVVALQEARVVEADAHEDDDEQEQQHALLRAQDPACSGDDLVAR
jgi:hypothetical protein